MLSEKELKAIEARCEAATPGPWENWNDNHFHVGTDTQKIATMCVPHAPEINCANAFFIAHARTDIPALIAHIREIEADKALVWTSATPTVDGNYWWLYEDGQPINGFEVSPVMVNVIIFEGKFHFFFHYGEGAYFHLCDQCRWAGPIPTPKDPMP